MSNRNLTGTRCLLSTLITTVCASSVFCSASAGIVAEVLSLGSPVGTRSVPAPPAALFLAGPIRVIAHRDLGKKVGPANLFRFDVEELERGADEQIRGEELGAGSF